MGKYGAGNPRLLGFGFLVSCCPGPGSSLGNLTVPPASKEAKSPSTLFLFCSVQGGGLPEDQTSKGFPVFPEEKRDKWTKLLVKKIFPIFVVEGFPKWFYSPALRGEHKPISTGNLTSDPIGVTIPFATRSGCSEP